MTETTLYEVEADGDVVDPDEVPIRDRKLVIQPFDMTIDSLNGQIIEDTIHVRPISQKPKFQRKYVWSNKFASQLIESLILNVPIPPIYLSENEDFQYDVIDGQQRVFSIYRFLGNQFKLSGLEVLRELNGLQFFELDRKLQAKIKNKTLRCVTITSDSHPEIKFEVFERLNTNTAPLNAQELRNCTNRGALNDLLGELAEYGPWLSVLGRKEPDKRLRDEELILRFFAFYELGVRTYRTPQKHWLNDMAKRGARYDDAKIDQLRTVWKAAVDRSVQVFGKDAAFRRIDSDPDGKRKAVNKALMDLVMNTFSRLSDEQITRSGGAIRTVLVQILDSDEVVLNEDTFNDLISRAVDHTTRVKKRFEIWNAAVAEVL